MPSFCAESVLILHQSGFDYYNTPFLERTGRFRVFDYRFKPERSQGVV